MAVGGTAIAADVLAEGVSEQEIVADPSTIRSAYLRELAGLTLTYDRELRGAGIDYLQLDTSQPLDFALLAYLAARARWK